MHRLLFLFFFALLFPGLAEAQKKRRGPVEVPIDIGIGPAAHFITGPIGREQAVLGGLAISGAAVLDNPTLRKLRNRIPSKYRKQVLKMNEIRISHPLIPRTIWISPVGVGGAALGMYGVQLRPVGVGLPLIQSDVKLSLEAGLILSYFYLHGEPIENTHFLRPGIDPELVLEVPLSKRVLLSAGWASQLYIPQPIGGGILEIGALDESIWHVGQAFFKFHHRFPIKVRRR